MSKKLNWQFSDKQPKKDNTGMKFVLLQVTTDQNEIINEWGFCDWEGDTWGPVPAPDNFTYIVKWWANTVDPALLLEEPKKIITLPGIN